MPRSDYKLERPWTIFRCSLIHVAEWTLDGADQLANLVSPGTHDAKVDRVAERLKPAAEAHHGGAAGDDLLAVGKVLALPNVPGSVDHSVMKPKGRVVGRDVEVTARVASNGEVASVMHTVVG